MPPDINRRAVIGVMKTKIIILLSALLIAGCQCQKEEKPPASPPEARQVSVKELMQAKQADSQVLIQAGISSLAEGNAVKAIKRFHDALAVYPINAQAYFLLARTFLELRQYDEALKVMEEAGPNINIYGLLYHQLFAQDWYPEEPSPAGKVWIAPFKDNKSCALSFMFCDGSRTVYTNALPLLDKYGYKATIALISGKVADVVKDTVTCPRGSWPEWRNASNRGFEMCNHTMNHVALRQKPPQELEREVNGSYDLIREKTGRPPRVFIFPDYASDKESFAKVGERHVAIMDHDFLTQIYDRVFLPYYGGPGLIPEIAAELIDFSIQNKLWLIPICHAVRANEPLSMHRPVTVDFLKTHLADIRSRESEVWVDTCGRVYQYLYARRMSHIEIQEEGARSVSFCLTNALPPAVYSCPLTVVIDASPLRPRKVSAKRQGTDKPLETKVDGEKIYVSVVAGPEPVSVQWR